MLDAGGRVRAWKAGASEGVRLEEGSWRREHSENLKGGLPSDPMSVLETGLKVRSPAKAIAVTMSREVTRWMVGMEFLAVGVSSGDGECA
jgi:hypothetical protein